MDKSKKAEEEKAKFDAQLVRSQTGVGIDKVVDH